MSNTVLIYLVTYASLAAFGAVVGWRLYRILKMPMHVRWELYPVAHEPGDKPRYGGSYLEHVDWWKKERESSLFNELKYMIPEMTLLVALFEHNRKMWYRSFPFHFGLYTLAGLCGLIVLGAVMELMGIYVGPIGGASSLGVGLIVYYLTILTALGGLGLATLGALGLLQIRLTDPNQKLYASFGHIFNLLLFLAVFGVAWLTFIFADPGFAATRAFVQNLALFNVSAPIVTAQGSSAGGLLLSLEIVMAVLLIAYIPATHMSHFFIKFFTYHKIRWDDEPAKVGSEIERKVIENVMQPVTWSAAHLNADGKKNWVDIATEEMKK